MFKFIEYKQLPLWDFGWVSFHSVSNTNKNLTIKSVINDKNYQKTFLCPFDQEKSVGVHGPYKVEKLSENLYERISFQEFLKIIIEDVFSNSEFEIKPDRKQIDDVLFELNNKYSKDYDIYYLNIPNNDNKYTSEIGWVHIIFYDFIFIAFDKTHYTNIVFGYD